MTTHILMTDCHVHVFLPEIAPYAAQRSYSPGPADVRALENHLDRIGVSRVVVVQPSPHGTDNRATLAAVAGLGQACARGIAVVDPQTCSKEALAALAAAGIVGLRANLKTSGVAAVDAAEAYLNGLGRLMQGTDLLLEVFLPLPMMIALRPTLAALGRTVILDHWAGLKTSSPSIDDDFAQLQDLLSVPNLVLKTSGSCRATDYAPDTSALDAIAPALFDAAPGRVIWGSDWPHTGKSSERMSRPLSQIEPFMPIDDRKAMEDLKKWAATPERYAAILHYTPNSVFGF